MFKVGLEDEITLNEFTQLKKISDDDFLSKLCMDMGESELNDKEGKNVDEEVHATFNHNLHWKQQKHILGTRVENPMHLKNMLCNYVVASRYQLCFSKIIVKGF